MDRLQLLTPTERAARHSDYRTGYPESQHGKRDAEHLLELSAWTADLPDEEGDVPYAEIKRQVAEEVQKCFT